MDSQWVSATYLHISRTESLKHVQQSIPVLHTNLHQHFKSIKHQHVCYLTRTSTILASVGQTSPLGSLGSASGAEKEAFFSSAIHVPPTPLKNQETSTLVATASNDITGLTKPS